MYKLTVVSGPNRGTTYAIRDGGTSIGRQAGNEIVLTSSRVSKRHCVLVVSNGEIVVEDQGSSNGTFVNGVLTKKKKIGPGDRISVGDFVFEVGAPPSLVPRAAPSAAVVGNVIQFQGAGTLAGQIQRGVSNRGPSGAAGALPGASADPLAQSSSSVASSNAEPQDLLGRVLHAFERFVMPFFYGLALKNEWRFVAGALFGAAIFLSAVLSVGPLVDAGRDMTIREISRRAKFMARQISETNAAQVAAKAESKTDLGIVEGAEGVRMAVLTDLDGRIIAPAARANQFLAAGATARKANEAAKLFRNGRETGIVAQTGESSLVAIEPVRAMNPANGRNVTLGMAIVSVDTSMATLDVGEISTAYSQALIISGIIGVFIALILYRLTVRPFLVLNDDMDRALKGEMAQVTHEFKFAELNPLWDVINSALQRIPRGGAGHGLGGSMESAATAEDFAGPLQTLATAGHAALVVFDGDRKILAINPLFEEISGIRADAAPGQEVSAVARDQALGALVSDLFDRASPGHEGVTEDYDFSGIPHKVHMVALGRRGEPAKCYALMATKNG